MIVVLIVGQCFLVFIISFGLQFVCERGELSFRVLLSACRLRILLQALPCADFPPQHSKVGTNGTQSPHHLQHFLHGDSGRNGHAEGRRADLAGRVQLPADPGRG
jgi:hypothetical protein